MVTVGRLDYRDGSVQLDSNFIVDFNADMDAGSVVVTSSPQVAMTMEWLADQFRGVSLTPVTELAPATTYTLTVSGTTLTGDAITPPYSFSFHTQATPDRTNPTIVSTTPSNDATGVDPGTRFAVTFSEPMFEVHVGAQPALDFGTPTVTDLVTYTYEMPTANWAPGSTYSVSVVGYDLSANLVSQSVSFTVACLSPGGTCSQDSECCLGSCVDGGCP